VFFMFSRTRAQPPKDPCAACLELEDD